MHAAGAVFARATSDGDDTLVSADEPLASLQLHCGGELPGLIAIPALLELVRKARLYGFKLARPIHTLDGVSAITAWVEIEPQAEGRAGCDIAVRSWQTSPLPPEDVAAINRQRGDIDRQLSELTARLDAAQCLLAVESDAADLADAAHAMREGIGRPWTDFVTLDGNSHRQPMHWRLLDGARLMIAGSQRKWRASLLPLEVPGGEAAGFELCLTAETPLLAAVPEPAKPETAGPAHPGLVGRDLAPVLRLPISRIIANAETIRTRLAGPLAEEYSNYAADIAAAGQHLLALIDDLSDLEVVEADDFSTAPDRIDLADVARRAAGILGVRARERGIIVDAPRTGETLAAVAEFRRVLQVLLNLVSNAIRYSPTGSHVWIRLEDDDGRARITVADQGAGLNADQQARIFEKFERLGRSGDGGSGLGLYISRRLARAMGGDLTVESAPGQGARFILDLPADIHAAAADGGAPSTAPESPALSGSSRLPTIPAPRA